MPINLLVIGNGGRECALCWKLSQSPIVNKIYANPGNGGTLRMLKIENIDTTFPSYDDMGEWCLKNMIDLVIIGPEKYLAEGLVDTLTQKYKVNCFGPCMKAATLEADKSFAKRFMHKYNIPTASCEIFKDAQAALDYIKNDINKNKSHVIKANGLAGGKGVIIAKDHQEAIDGIREILIDKKFGSAGEKVVIEEMLYGPEISCLAFVDGETYALMPPSQDHKRAFDGDKGPNTGGMGAYCPCPLATPQIMDAMREQVFDKLMVGLRAENIHYVGVIYAGLMLTTDGLKVLEFNCRFGDPEIQVILPLLCDDLYLIMKRCCQGKLASVEPPKWDLDSYCAGVVVAANGYPTNPCHKLPVSGIPKTINRPASHLPENRLPPYPSISQIIFDAGTEWVVKPTNHLNDRSPSGDASNIRTGLTLDSSGLDQATSQKEMVLYTTGAGRLFTVVGKAVSLKLALALAYSLCSRFKIGPTGADYFYRNDIGQSGLELMQRTISLKEEEVDSYAKAGVDISRADAFLAKVAPALASTYRPGVMGGIGGFSAIFDLNAISSKYRDPLLISGTDGVGSKLKVALEYGSGFENVGIDLVAMSVNDVLASGAETLFFLDYFATGRLDVERANSVMQGIVKGCKSAGCALVGGETAEIPDLYKGDDFDLAGFAVGVVDRPNVLPKKSLIDQSDVLIGLISSGFHSNGFSLLRKVLRKNDLSYNDPCPWEDGVTLGHYLLTPTIIYNPYLCPLFEGDNGIKAFAHITGGGLMENIPRVLPPQLTARIETSSWPIPPSFAWIRELGALCLKDMGTVFNLGIGGVLVVAPEHAPKLLGYFDTLGIKAYTIGTIVKGTNVELLNLEESLTRALRTFKRCDHSIPRPYTTPSSITSPTQPNLVMDALKLTPKKKRVAVLISGTGTNLKALIEYSLNNEKCNYTVGLVLSNKPEAQGLKIAQDHGIETGIIKHDQFSKREDFDAEIDKVLQSKEIDFVCLAGFMRMLSAPFVQKWHGRLINTHPSLLPSFKGLHAPAQAIAAGCKLAGCTIHYVVPDMDAGPILAQEAVPIHPNDTEESLTERIKRAEHALYPSTLDKILSK